MDASLVIDMENVEEGEEKVRGRKKKRPNSRFYFALVHPLTLYELYKVKMLYAVTGTFALGWGTSPHFRCATLLIVPNILGKEGRAYLMIYVMASIYAGPISNLQHNLGEIAESFGCTVELQINNSRKLWKVMTVPLKAIVKNTIVRAKELKDDSNGIKEAFLETESEVEGTEGYDTKTEEEREKNEKESSKNKTLGTQKKFSVKSVLRCEYVVEQGVDRCKDWFDKKHDDCMRAIVIPILNSLLCLPMKFSFLCNLMYVVNAWCKQKIPIEENFGETFDKVDGTMNNMDNGFNTKEVVKKEEQSWLVGVGINPDKIKADIKENLNKKQSVMLKAGSFVQLVLSCTFVFLLFSAYRYIANYNGNIRFDNFYVTTYFRQIDARRKKRKKRTLLPLRKGEHINYVFPFKPKIQGPEMKTTMMEFMQCVPVLVFLMFSLITDWLLYHLLMIIRKHSHITYVFASKYELELVLGMT
ncbi:E3 ubiquitin- ligase DCST1 [Pelobates cultripes]|uniref:E3 ubiquitin- ligase DCST1 n=1 Tax=Pelobates cultripes TaxID=61616 RepID=A0AAD1TJ91_PELCU|nr:E3 ubiquitin- ligase DCST1 [Pelobates cultripes]